MDLTVSMISRNEERAVGSVLDDIRATVPQAEILLVDSSTDQTPVIAESKGARVIRQVPPRGYGPAMMAALLEAHGDVIVTMDCDGTYPTKFIPRLAKLVTELGYDVVNATRLDQRPDAMPYANYLANRVFAHTTSVAYGFSTSDMHSGMRAYRRSMLHTLSFDPHGPALPVELWLKPILLGYRAAEVPIPYFERVGESTLNRFQSTGWTFRRIGRGVKWKLGSEPRGVQARPRVDTISFPPD
jgi:glycosyltransferase involved in cell wall biosynthesis